MSTGPYPKSVWRNRELPVSAGKILKRCNFLDKGGATLFSSHCRLLALNTERTIGHVSLRTEIMITQQYYKFGLSIYRIFQFSSKIRAQIPGTSFYMTKLYNIRYVGVKVDWVPLRQSRSDSRMHCPEAALGPYHHFLVLRPKM